MAAASSSRRTCITLKDKIAVLNDLDKGLSYDEVQKKYGFKHKTNITGKHDQKRSAADHLSSGIVKRKADLQAALSHGMDVKRKCVRKGKFSEVEAEVEEFIRTAGNLGHVLTRSIIQEKAKQVAEAQGIDGFRASSGWVTKFEKRNGIACVTIHGEAAKVSEVTVENWAEQPSSL